MKGARTCCTPPYQHIMSRILPAKTKAGPTLLLQCHIPVAHSCLLYRLLRSSCLCQARRLLSASREQAAFHFVMKPHSSEIHKFWTTLGREMDVPTHRPPDRAWRKHPLVLLTRGRCDLASRNELTVDFGNESKIKVRFVSIFLIQSR